MAMILVSLRRIAGMVTVWLLINAPAMAQVVPDWTITSPGSMVTPVDSTDSVLVADTVLGAVPNFRISKISASGAVVWTTWPLPDAVNLSTKVLQDRDGNLAVTGTAATGPFVAKFDRAGNLVWRSNQSPSLGWPALSALDSMGAVYVVQRSYIADPAVNNERYVLSKYAPNGALEWSRDCGPSVPYPWSSSLAVTGSGLPVVMNFPAFWRQAGEPTLTVFDAAGNKLQTKPIPVDLGIGAMVGPTGEYVLVGGSGGRALVIKHDGAMNELWRQTLDVGNAASAGAIDATGNIYFPATTGTSTTLSAYATVKLHPTGSLAWSRTVGPTVDGLVPTAGVSIRFWLDASVYMLGSMPLRVVDAYGNVSKHDRAVVLKYSPDGTEQWRSALVDARWGSDLALTSGGGVLAQMSQTNMLPLLLRYSQSGLSNQAPTALASANPSAGVAPLAVQFSANGSTDSDGAIADYLWTFGDGQVSNSANPSHTYAAGNYLATLRLTDNIGASSTSSVAVTVSLPPPKPIALVLASPTVLQRTGTTATVTLANTAGATVSLTSSDTSAANVPSSIVVPRGVTSATFLITTLKVAKSKTVTIGAVANGGSVSALLTVTPR